MTAYAPAMDTEGVKANALKKCLGVLIADDVVMLEDRQRLLAMSRAQHRAHVSWIHRLWGGNQPEWEGEDDMIHVGDIYQNIQVPGEEPSAIVADRAVVKLKAPSKRGPSRVKRLAAVGLLCVAAWFAPAAIAELTALFSAVAEVKVLWDGQEIKPGDTASGGATQ